MRVPDAVIGAGFVVAGAAVFTATLGFPRLEGGAPGPALFPQILAVLMVAFGGTLAATAIAARGRGGLPEPAAVPSRFRSGGAVNALLVFAAIIAFMLVSPSLGFLVTAALILLGLMWWLGTPPLRAALAAAGLTLFVYLIFAKVLRVPLPLGLVWF